MRIRIKYWTGIKILIIDVLTCRWGRKPTLLSSVVPFSIGWILVASAGHVAQLYVARLILGVALGFAFTIVPMYCGEIAEVNSLGVMNASGLT